MTVRIDGRSYEVERVDKPGERPDYLLRGVRGARYRTMRNVPKPDFMFLVNDASFLKGAPKAWLTDRSGDLEVLR